MESIERYMRPLLGLCIVVFVVESQLLIDIRRYGSGFVMIIVFADNIWALGYGCVW